jgi:hypothetical protein
MSPGVATNFWTASGFVPPVRKSPHAERPMKPKAQARTETNRRKVMDRSYPKYVVRIGI